MYFSTLSRKEEERKKANANDSEFVEFIKDLVQ